jgi:fucose permease
MEYRDRLGLYRRCYGLGSCLSLVFVHECIFSELPAFFDNLLHAQRQRNIVIPNLSNVHAIYAR